MEKKVVKGNVLAEGETTGHAHRVQVKVMERIDGLREFDGATTITHEEHKPITLPEKKWVSGIVQEYDYLAEMSRNVRD